MFHGSGQCAAIETTALASMALIQSGTNPEATHKALAWLVTQKDASGSWHSTQATILALKALLAGSGKPLGENQPRRVEIAIDGKPVHTAVIPADQADLTRQIDLAKFLSPGEHQITLRDRDQTAVGYQLTLSYYTTEPIRSLPNTNEPLTIELKHDKTQIAVNDVIDVNATVTNQRSSTMAMVIVDLPIPAGFQVGSEPLGELVAKRTIAKYQLTPRSVIIYLRSLAPGAPLVVPYRLRATMPVKVHAQPARAYEYYDPDVHAHSAAAVQLEVVEESL